MLTLEERFQKLTDDNISLTINNFGWSAGKWRVQISKQADGVSLEVTRFAPSFEEAFDNAWDQYFDTAKQGNPSLVRAEIEYQSNDDIPF